MTFHKWIWFGIGCLNLIISASALFYSDRIGQVGLANGALIAFGVWVILNKLEEND